MANATHKEKGGTEHGRTGFAEDAKEMAESAGRQAKGIAQKVGQEAKKVGEQAESFVASAAEKAKESATYLGEKAEQATGSVGAGMESLGGTIRDYSPKQGVLHNAGETMAAKLETGGRYLEEHGLHGIGEDMTKLIRQNPIPAVLIGIGLGFILARLTRS